MAFDGTASGFFPGPDSPMTFHRPVMLDEALTGLDVRAGGVYFDCTFGRGGHARAILERLGGSGALHALDQDPEAVAYAKNEFALHGNFTIHRANFDKLAAIAIEAGVAGKVDGVLMDLGVSSPQLDEARRGFSFASDGPLDMRMDPDQGEPASQWLARADADEIADVLYRLGEERNSRRIARRIVETRTAEPITTTRALAELIASVPGPRSHKIHPATRSFQAIRIHVNGELDELEAGLSAAERVLKSGGRLAVVSFHSLEDRIVKRFLREAAGANSGTSRHLPTRAAGPAPTFDKLSKAIRPSDAETLRNPRARSATLRAAIRTDAPARMAA